MANLRAGLIGLGMMGRHHARVLRELPGVDLVAIADPGGDPHGVAGGLPVLPRRRGADRRRASTLRRRRPDRHPRGDRRWRSPRPACTRSSRSRSPQHRRRRRAIADAFAARRPGRRVGHIERFNPALQHAAAAASRPASSARSTRSPPAGRARSRRASPTSASSRTSRTHDIDLTAWVAQSRYASVVAHDRAPQRPRARGPGRGRPGSWRTASIANHLVNWLSPDEGAGHDRHRRDGRLRRRHADRPT